MGVAIRQCRGNHAVSTANVSAVNMPSRDLSLLAPKFLAAVEAAIAACAARGLPVKINEGYRSQARQAFLYAQGRTTPGNIVTNAPSSLTSWHGYGLAVDVIHATLAYTPFGSDRAANERWFADVGGVFKHSLCSWGGNWTKPDTPHMQWGACTPSPTMGARSLLATGGVEAVWRKLGAL